MLTLYEPLVWLAKTLSELPMCYGNCFLRNIPSKYELNRMVFGSLCESTWLCAYREFFLSNLWWFGGGVWEAKEKEFGEESEQKDGGRHRADKKKKKKEECPVAERKRSRRRVQEESLFRSGCLNARQAEGTQTAGDGGEV